MGRIKLNCLTEDTSYLLKIKTMSERFSLNKEDILKISTGAGIALAGALLTYLAELIPNVDFGQYSELVAAILMILINAGRKFLAGK